MPAAARADRLRPQGHSGEPHGGRCGEISEDTQEYTYLGLEQPASALPSRRASSNGRNLSVHLVGVVPSVVQDGIELARMKPKARAAACPFPLLAPLFTDFFFCFWSLRPFAGPPTRTPRLRISNALARETRCHHASTCITGPGADVSIPDTIALGSSRACISSMRLARPMPGLALIVDI